MKKILAVVGSPRRNGNTHILVSKIAEGARTKGAIVEELFLGDLSINECDGCHVCWKGKECSKNDDMRDVYWIDDVKVLQKGQEMGKWNYKEIVEIKRKLKHDFILNI